MYLIYMYFKNDSLQYITTQYYQRNIRKYKASISAIFVSNFQWRLVCLWRLWLYAIFVWLQIRPSLLGFRWLSVVYHLGYEGIHWIYYCAYVLLKPHVNIHNSEIPVPIYESLADHVLCQYMKQEISVI